MLRPIIAAVFAASLSAQDSVEAIAAEYQQRRAAAVEKAGGILPLAEQMRLATWWADALDAHLAKAPPDRVEARLGLVEVLLWIREPERAAEALGGLEVDAATMTELLRAAELAGSLELPERRKAWIDAALAKPAPLDERMRAGLLLMTRLLDPERAERLFAAALESAKDDEQRAFVLWHRANATREREDLEDGAYEAALGGLATRFPKTTWGAVAADRLRAMAYEVGDPAVEIAGPELGGERVALSDLRGQVVLLWYWGSWSSRCRDAAARIGGLLDTYGERGVAVLGVSLDEDRAQAEAFPAPGRTLFDGRGLESPLALRNNVEHVPYALLVDSEGKIAALRLSFWSDGEVEHVAAAIEAAL